jgi:hypothetical protein
METTPKTAKVEDSVCDSDDDLENILFSIMSSVESENAIRTAPRINELAEYLNNMEEQLEEATGTLTILYDCLLSSEGDPATLRSTFSCFEVVLAKHLNSFDDNDIETLASKIHTDLIESRPWVIELCTIIVESTHMHMQRRILGTSSKAMCHHIDSIRDRHSRNEDVEEELFRSSILTKSRMAAGVAAMLLIGDGFCRILHRWGGPAQETTLFLSLREPEVLFAFWREVHRQTIFNHSIGIRNQEQSQSSAWEKVIGILTHSCKKPSHTKILLTIIMENIKDARGEADHNQACETLSSFIAFFDSRRSIGKMFDSTFIAPLLNAIPTIFMYGSDSARTLCFKTTRLATLIIQATKKELFKIKPYAPHTKYDFNSTPIITTMMAIKELYPKSAHDVTSYFLPCVIYMSQEKLRVHDAPASVFMHVLFISKEYKTNAAACEKELEQNVRQTARLVKHISYDKKTFDENDEIQTFKEGILKNKKISIRI